jgi:hypothetical protein
MFIVSIILQSLLLFFMSYQSITKIAGAQIQVELFKSIELPQWMRKVTGFVQLIGCVGIIIGYWYQEVAAWAGIWLGITMLLACLAHLRVKHPIGKAVPAFVIVLIAVILVILDADGILT